VVQPPAEKQTERWQQQLTNRIPVIGGWLRLEAARLLKQAASQGNAQAMNTLALAFVATKDQAVKKEAREAILSADIHPSIDAIWMAWIATRSRDLLQILLDKNWVASAPPKARLYSALRLEKLELVTKGSAEIVPFLIEACQDNNAQLAASAEYCLAQLEKQEAIDALCDLWVQSRTPLLEDAVREGRYLAQSPPAARVYSALVNNRPEFITGGSADVVDSLLQACVDSDPAVRGSARQAVGKLLNPVAIDRLCASWVERRTGWLGEVITVAGYVAREPARVRLLSAAHCEISTPITACAPEEIEAAVEIVRSDPDESIRIFVRQALSGLSGPETRDALCRLAAEKEDPLASEIARQAGYVPTTPENRALFYFMLERWDEYETLDFDRRLMQAVFQTADRELRSRITRKLQRSGRVDFLGVLTGAIHSTLAELSEGEIEPVVNMLQSHQQWEKLWDLSLEVPFQMSARIIRTLRQFGWKPESQPDCETFDILASLVDTFPDRSLAEWLRTTPPVTPQAKIHISARVNSVAISPNRPLIALAAGNRRVVLWNFQKAAVEQVLRGFEHSVGKVAFTPGGILLCAERAAVNTDLCRLYTWDGAGLCPLGAHIGSITALEPVGSQRALSAGKDEMVYLWDLSSRKQVSQKDLHFWPRSARVSPDGSEAVLLDRTVAFISLPDLNFLKKAGYSTRSRQANQHGVASVAIYFQGSRGLILGRSTGQAIVFTPIGDQSTVVDRVPLANEWSEVRCVDFLERHGLIVLAFAQGEIQYYRWPEKVLVARVKTGGKRLTSLSVSTDGAFMASGDSDASLCLWDFQALDLSDLAQKPLSLLASREFAAVHSLHTRADLPTEVRACARYIQTVIHHRTRFDIQLDELRTVRAGEFDIMIE